MIRSHIMRLSTWSSEGVADLPILWIPQFSYHLTINVVRSPKVRGVGDNLLIVMQHVTSWCITSWGFIFFGWATRYWLPFFFSGERMMNQSKDQTLKMKDTAIRIHQHQAPFSTEQDVISPGRFTFRSQNAVTNTSLSRTFIVLAPRNGLVQDPE